MYGGALGTLTPPDLQSLSKTNNFTFLVYHDHIFLPIHLHICVHLWMPATPKKTKCSGLTVSPLKKHVHAHTRMPQTPQREPFVPP